MWSSCCAATGLVVSLQRQGTSLMPSPAQRVEGSSVAVATEYIATVPRIFWAEACCVMAILQENRLRKIYAVLWRASECSRSVCLMYMSPSPCTQVASRCKSQTGLSITSLAKRSKPPIKKITHFSEKDHHPFPYPRSPVIAYTPFQGIWKPKALLRQLEPWLGLDL